MSHFVAVSWKHQFFVAELPSRWDTKDKQLGVFSDSMFIYHLLYLYLVFFVYPLEILISLVDCAVIQLMAQPLYHPKGFQYI